MKRIVVLATGKGPGTLLADDFYLGSESFRDDITLRQAIDSAHFDITMLERELDHESVFLLAPCEDGRLDGSRMQVFERLVLERAILKHAQCGLLVTRLANCLSKHLMLFGPKIGLIVSQDDDKSGGLESVYPRAILYEAPSTFSMPKVVSAILQQKQAA